MTKHDRRMTNEIQITNERADAAVRAFRIRASSLSSSFVIRFSSLSSFLDLPRATARISFRKSKCTCRAPALLAEYS
jgi:hypothetical protein